MSSRRPSPPAHQRKTIALKRADGEPLTRADLQYDVLYNIFKDTHNVFTAPYPADNTAPAKLCFRELYLKTILHSPKATKVLTDKMNESALFAEDFGMLALLVNVGRVNTTMSCKFVTGIQMSEDIHAHSSLSRDEDDYPHLPPGASIAENSGKSPGCTTHQAHTQS